MTPTDAFNWQLEEAFINAWPSAASLTYDNWLVRFSGDAVRRTNSVNPLNGPRAPTGAIAGFAEGLYKARGRKALFRPSRRLLHQARLSKRAPTRNGSTPGSA